ncbi:hypothetical protein [Methylobacterium gnaphalii]|uniref:hypothetical protein n=1 Tax=Methylobacterium gnaphalii TaxID=1010610 RepID=UPI0011BE2467|nr:hypothetical protein [Methylobacterium gnaphalii]
MKRAGKSRDDANPEDQSEADNTAQTLEEPATDAGSDDDMGEILVEAGDDEEDDDTARSGRGSRKATVRAAVEADRVRSSTIMELARAAGLSNFGRRHVDYGTSVREFRRALRERQGKPGARKLHDQPSFSKEVSRGAKEAQRALGRR